MTTITLPRATVEQALEALENAEDHLAKPYSTDASKAITALRTALAQQAEPDWQDLYLKEKQRADMWRDKYESVAGAEQRIYLQAEAVEPVAHLWQQNETGRTRVVTPDQFITADDGWRMVGPLYLVPPQQAEPVQEPYTDDVTRIMREAGMTFHLGLPHKAVVEQMTRVVDLVYAEASIKAAQQFAAALAQQAEPVAKVELMMTGGNAGLATRIVEIDDHLRERLRPGQLLYTSPPQHPDTDCHTQGICQRSGYGIGKQAEPVEPVAWSGYDLDGMVQAFSRVIEAHSQRANPFHNPIDMDAQMALRILRGFIPAMKAYTAPPQRKPLTEEEIAAEWQKASECASKSEGAVTTSQFVQMFARAVERAHGIKE